MVKDVCLNGTMANTHNYSAPVPWVGAYIAAASLVCLFLVLCDVRAGFRHNKYWFPCRLFSINSVTVTLISIASKIPVDLTTTMPSKQDQLSKLFGTVFICATMCFMLPSLAMNAEFESYANVMALNIFIITVVVNVCLQMATGVIFNFIPEHIIILIFMLFLLMKFWFSVTTINVYKNEYADVSKDLIRNGDRNMLTRLRNCYLYGYHSCPQLYACRHGIMGDVDAVCMMCSIVLVQATLRSFISKDLNFCEGVSDYQWSIWLVVCSQGLTLAFVSFAVASRWLIGITHFTGIFEEEKKHGDSTETYLQFQFLLSFMKLPSFVEKSFRFVFFLPLYIGHFLIVVFYSCLHSVMFLVYDWPRHWLCGNSDREYTRDKNSMEFMRQHVPIVDDWALQKGMADMKRLEIDENMTLKHLHSVLSTVTLSQASYFKVGLNGEGIQISLLSMMLLVQMAKLVIPRDKVSVSLENVLAEVFEIILFIENRLNTGSSEDSLRSKLATVIHQYGLIRSGVDEFSLKHEWDLENGRVDFIVDRKPICRICEREGPVESFIHREARRVSGFISYHLHESSEVVYGRIEQLFMHMLHTFLAHLPGAVFTHILESPVEVYQDRVRLGLGFISNLQSVESHIRFLLPSGSNITSLFHTNTIATTMRVEDTPVQGVSTHSPNIAPAVKVSSEIQEDAQATCEQV